ncbi:unnamed protein product [Symbiodinium sp. KB8]|nr:unnamed protein product [Symbiodinium sp. KB8]
MGSGVGAIGEQVSGAARQRVDHAAGGPRLGSFLLSAPTFAPCDRLERLGPPSARLVSDHVSELSEALSLAEDVLDEERAIEELLGEASNLPLGSGGSESLSLAGAAGVAKSDAAAEVWVVLVELDAPAIPDYGTIMHMLLDKDPAFPKTGKAWVQKAHVERLHEGQDKKVWKWAQMTFYRKWKQERFMELGLLSDDLDQLDGLDEVAILPYPAIPAGGIELQHLHFGWGVLVWSMLVHTLPCKTLGFISPGWTQPLYLYHENAKVDVAAFIDCIKKQMTARKLNFLPLGSGGHWVLLVIDGTHESGTPQVRYYDSLPDESSQCRDYAEKILASLLSMGLVHEAVLPPRMNRVFQGIDECGFHVLAAMEQEAATAMGFGKAPTGWPAHSAKKWHERLHKITNAVHAEQKKRLDELKQHKKKEESAMAEKRLAKGLELSELQKQAHEVISQGKVLEIADMPPAYHQEADRIRLMEIGVCSRCRQLEL